MPVRFDERLTTSGEQLVNDIESNTSPDFMETVSAAFSVDNTIGSLLARESNLPDKIIDTNYNPWFEMTEEEKLDSVFVSNASYADNPMELEAVRRQSENERRNRQTLQDAGAMGVMASIGAGIFDPINLIPVGGTAYKTYKTGSNILTSALATGTAATVGAGMTEAALHATQLERTYGESAMNMAGAFLLGGALGGGIAGISGRDLNDVNSQILDSMDVEPKLAGNKDSVGSARVSDEVQIKGKVTRVIAKSLAFDPLTRSLTNTMDSTRSLAASLAENPYMMDGENPTAVESLIKSYDGYYVRALEKSDSFYEDLQKELGGATGIKGLINRKGMRRREFNELVAKELRNPKDETPAQIKGAAQAWKKEFYDPIKNRAIEVGIFSDDIQVTTATNYVNRIWNAEKLKANRQEFVNITAKWLGDEQAKLADEIQAAKVELETIKGQTGKKGRTAELEEFIKKGEFKESLDLDDLDFRDTAEQIADRIIGTPDGMLPYDWKIGEGSKANANFRPANDKLKGPLKARTFNIPDESIEDFLDNDIELLGGRLLRSVAPDIELTRAFGDVEMKQQLSEIQQEARQMRAKAKDAKEVKKINDELESGIRDISAMRDRIRGTYGNVDHNNPWVRAGRAARNLNYMRFMGGVVASSVPDVARIFMAEGFANAFRFGLKPLVSNLKKFKVSAAEAKQYGVGAIGVERRAEIIADISDYTQGGTALERALQAGANTFSNINVMNQWTVGVKQLHAVVMQNRVINDLLKAKTPKQTLDKLNRLGINADDARLITEQLKKHSTKSEGVYLSNAKKWDDARLEEVWGAALRKESDRVIVTPGQEKPLFMSSELGKTILQFRSFMFSATQRMLIAGMQGQEANYMGGMLSIISLGIMSYAFKQWDAGREISDDPTTLLVEGIDRSGALGMLMEINNTAEKLSGNNLGLRPLLGVSAPASRFASRSQAENLLGPTFGSFLSTALQVSNATTSANEWTEADTRALRRLLPYQNLTFIRQGFDKIEETIHGG